MSRLIVTVGCHRPYPVIGTRDALASLCPIGMETRSNRASSGTTNGFNKRLQAVSHLCPTRSFEMPPGAWESSNNNFALALAAPPSGEIVVAT